MHIITTRERLEAPIGIRLQEWCAQPICRILEYGVSPPVDREGVAVFVSWELERDEDEDDGEDRACL
jgi:hypothetical protein